MAKRRNFIDRVPLAPVFALMFGTAVAIVIAATPQGIFESAIASSGLGSILTVAQPPLGLKARLLAVALGFALVAILVWLSVSAVQRLIAGPVARADDGFDDGFDNELDLGVYADSLPPVDAPRRPIFADKELGAPFMSDEALATMAATLDPVMTLDVPVAEPEPSLILEAPESITESDDVVAKPEVLFAPVLVDPVLEAPLEFAEFDLPLVTGDAEVLPGESAIDTLIRRLEAGLARRAGPPPSGPASPTAHPANVMRDMLAANREVEAQNDAGSARALDTLQRLAARRIAG
jgi:hypothetical protein